MRSVPSLPQVFLESAHHNLPGPLVGLRQQRRAALANMPLPTRKTENWKYSSRHLKLSEELAPALTDSVYAGVKAPLTNPGYRIVIRNGVIDPDYSVLPNLDGLHIQRFRDLEEEDALILAERLENTLDSQTMQLARLNSARFEDGLFIHMDDGFVLDQPIFLIHEVTGHSSGSSYPRLYVNAAKNSQMTLVEHYSSNVGSPVMVNAVTEFMLAEGAQITNVRLNLEDEDVQHLGATGARLAASSRFESHTVGLGGPLRRHDLRVRLEGEHAACKLNGVVVTQGKQHYDNHTTIEHVAAHCNSEETYRNIAADQSHAVFNGRIYIHQNAQKSSADMNNKNLLLSTGAEIDTKPELEIYADDVTCAHGATIGQLDETSLLYLLTRGIGRREAHTLLTMAFINELVEQIPIDAVRQTVLIHLHKFFDRTFEQPMNDGETL